MQAQSSNSKLFQKGNFSVITLLPTNEQLRTSWWQYRCSDVTEMYAMVTIYEAINALQLIFQYLTGADYVRFLLITNSLVLQIGLFYISKQSQKWFIRLLPVVYVLQ